MLSQVVLYRVFINSLTALIRAWDEPPPEWEQGKPVLPPSMQININTFYLYITLGYGLCDEPPPTNYFY